MKNIDKHYVVEVGLNEYLLDETGRLVVMVEHAAWLGTLQDAKELVAEALAANPGALKGEEITIYEYDAPPVSYPVDEHKMQSEGKA